MRGFNSELYLTTSEAADLLDVHPSTVKRWTDGGELPSRKTDGGHRRIYLRDAVEFAEERGQHTFLAPFAPFESHVWLAVREAMASDDFDRIVSVAMGWLVRGYPRRITALVHELGSRSDLPFARVCDRGIRAFMESVGLAWKEGRLRIGEEHIASQAVLEALVRNSSEGIEARPQRDVERPVAVVGSMEGDRHSLGAMCARILLERAGWNVQYPGADTPPEDFAALQRARGADLVCVSFSPRSTVGDLKRCLDVLREYYRPQAPFDLVLGGAAAGELELDPGLPFRGVHRVPSAEEFADWLQSLGERPEPALAAATGADT